MALGVSLASLSERVFKRDANLDYQKSLPNRPLTSISRNRSTLGLRSSNIQLYQRLVAAIDKKTLYDFINK